MKYLYVLIGFAIIFSASCNDPKPREDVRQEYQEKYDNEGIDVLKAKKYGADEYGMKKYIMVFLKKGPNRVTDSLKNAEIQKAHLANMDQMAEDGKLVLAGPFLEEGDLRGIYIFNVQSTEEAEALTNTDPAIKAGSLIAEYKEWYGSAALMAVNDIHKKIQEKDITE